MIATAARRTAKTTAWRTMDGTDVYVEINSLWHLARASQISAMPPFGDASSQPLVPSTMCAAVVADAAAYEGYGILVAQLATVFIGRLRTRPGESTMKRTAGTIVVAKIHIWNSVDVKSKREGVLFGTYLLKDLRADIFY